MLENFVPTTASSPEFVDTTRVQDLATIRPIKAEVNLLRLPFFSLQTKGLRGLDGFECHGTVTRNGEKHQYRWRVTRHATYSFPGPLSRAAHLAFLGIMSERGVPFQNPVVWKWRDLCRRMDIPYSGRTVQELKEAIKATHGVIIESTQAIYSKSAHGVVELNEDDRHLYARVQFSSRKPVTTGQVKDENQVWLSQWYLDSFNALYTAPLDHDLWRYLDKHSAIASRFYEYLLPAFYRPVPSLAINYPQLAQSLPIRQERFFSDAHKQLDHALALLVKAQVLKAVQWEKRPGEVAQLRLFRGDQLAAAKAVESVPIEVDLDQHLTVREIRNSRSAEERLVMDFYRLWAGRKLHRPTPAELEQAKQIIAEHGVTKSCKLIPVIVRQLKQQWPAAKTFSAAIAYLPDAIASHHRQEQLRVRERQEQERLELAEQRRKADHEQHQRFTDQWEPLWNELSAATRQDIELHILNEKPWLNRTRGRLHYECLKQLEKQIDRDSGQSHAV